MQFKLRMIWGGVNLAWLAPPHIQFSSEYGSGLRTILSVFSFPRKWETNQGLHDYEFELLFHPPIPDWLIPVDDDAHAGINS